MKLYFNGQFSRINRAEETPSEYLCKRKDSDKSTTISFSPRHSFLFDKEVIESIF
jgi:hypothetical protein